MMIGKRINERYKLIRPAGGGGMADVYLAKDLILDRLVAVKMLKSQFSEDEEFIRRFHREAESASSLFHDNIVSIFDVGEEDGLYYIVMEYVEGQTLKEYVQEHGSLEVKEAVRILSQITEAVSHAHYHHIIHRDIKPQNILMSINGTAKVTDFGIARAISEATITHTNSVLGSVHYLSPEQARGGKITYKSDLYALGVILYEMLAGEVPYSGDTAVTIALKHLQEPFPKISEVNPSIPQSVENMIMKLTAKNPDNRYESADEVFADLQTVLSPGRINEEPLHFEDDDEVTKAVPVINPETPPEESTMVPPIKNKNAEKEEKSGRRPWMWGVLGAVFLIGLLFIVIAVVPRFLHVDEVEVPNVAGLTSAEALEELEELDLEADLQEREDDSVPVDHVISVRPEAGTSVKIGSEVTLIVSSTEPVTGMENVLGLSEAEAEEALADYASVNVSYRETTEEPDDTVIEQLPAPGENTVPEETEVELIVTEREVFTLGNLYGMTREEVLEELNDAPYIDLAFEEQYHDSMEEGRVFFQEPARGTEISESITVDVTFSQGPEEEETDSETNNEENNEEENNEEMNNEEMNNEEMNNEEQEIEPEPSPEETEDNNADSENNDEQEGVRAEVPFAVNLPDSDGENSESYAIEIQVEDAINHSPQTVIEEEITESTQFAVPMAVEPGGSAALILIVDGEEFAESPYNYTYEEVQQYE
jgi:eukaryotic-like serine/threonine-protein kinase